MDMLVSVRSIVYFIIGILSTGVGIMLIAVLVKTFLILRKVENLMDENSENITNLLTILPETVDSVNQSVQSVKKTVDNANDTMELISESVVSKAVGALSGTERIFDIIRVISDVVRSFIQNFMGK